VEAQYIKHYDDLISIHPKKRSWFRHAVQKWVRQTLFYSKLLKYFRRIPFDHDIVADGYTTWIHEKRIGYVSSCIIAFVGLAMLIGPLWILEAVEKDETRLGIITGFIALFFVMVGVATTARVSESLVAAAAYSAVLMVFLQIGDQTNGSSVKDQ
jgi:hypothetical protein